MDARRDLPHRTVPIYLTHSDVGIDSVLAALEVAGFQLDELRPATRTVLDTFDGRLHATGSRLELRNGHQRELVLMGPAGSLPAHLPWEVAAPSRAADLPPGPFGARVAAAIVERALLPILEVSSTCRRATRDDRRDKPVVTVVVHDDVRASPAPAESLPAWVVEVSASTGHESEVDRVVATLAALGLRARDGDLIDAVLAATGRTLAGHSDSPTVPLRRGDDSLEAFRLVLRNLLTSITDNLPGTLADLDPEFLHDLRVAVRRTRSVLAEGKKVLPPEIRDHFRAGFATLGAATGRARDLDVYLLGYADTVGRLQIDDPSVLAPLLSELEDRRESAYAEMAAVLRSDDTRELLDGWRRWLDDPAVVDSDAGPVGPYIASRIAKAQAGLLRDGRAITAASPAERLHDLRKDAKRLRYLFECFGSLLPTKGRKSFVAQLKALQDNLGQHQDAEVQVAELRDLAHHLRDRLGIGTDTLLAVGRLVDHLERVRQRERDAFDDRFAAYDTPANASLLDALLAKAATA